MGIEFVVVKTPIKWSIPFRYTGNQIMRMWTIDIDRVSGDFAANNEDMLQLLHTFEFHSWASDAMLHITYDEATAYRQLTRIQACNARGHMDGHSVKRRINPILEVPVQVQNSVPWAHATFIGRQY